MFVKLDPHAGSSAVRMALSWFSTARFDQMKFAIS